MKKGIFVAVALLLFASSEVNAQGRHGCGFKMNWSFGCSKWNVCGQQYASPCFLTKPCQPQYIPCNIGQSQYTPTYYAPCNTGGCQPQYTPTYYAPCQPCPNGQCLPATAPTPSVTYPLTKPAPSNLATPKRI